MPAGCGFGETPIKIGRSIYYTSMYDGCIAFWMGAVSPVYHAIGGRITMISSDIALIGTTIHRVAQLIQQRIDQDIRGSGLTRLSWMAAAHVEDAPG